MIVVHNNQGEQQQAFEVIDELLAADLQLPEAIDTKSERHGTDQTVAATLCLNALAMKVGLPIGPDGRIEKTTKTLEQDPFISAGEVAGIMRVSSKTIQRWSNKGRLPVRRTLGGHRRFRVSHVIAFLAAIDQET